LRLARQITGNIISITNIMTGKIAIFRPQPTGAIAAIAIRDATEQT
jgi:hypothetical protein